MPQRGKVHKIKHRKMSVGEKLYADDLQGCTVVAAVWPTDNDGKTHGFYAHAGGETIQDDETGPATVDRIRSKIRRITEEEGSSPEGVWLVYARQHGREQHPEGNNRIREMLQDEGIEFTGEKYRWAHNMPETVELWPGKAEPLVVM